MKDHRLGESSREFAPEPQGSEPWAGAAPERPRSRDDRSLVDTTLVGRVQTASLGSAGQAIVGCRTPSDLRRPH